MVAVSQYELSTLENTVRIVLSIGIFMWLQFAQVFHGELLINETKAEDSAQRLRKGISNDDGVDERESRFEGRGLDAVGK